MFRSKLEESVADILFENEVRFDYEEDKIPYVLEKMRCLMRLLLN